MSRRMRKDWAVNDGISIAIDMARCALVERAVHYRMGTVKTGLALAASGFT